MISGQNLNVFPSLIRYSLKSEKWSYSSKMIIAKSTLTLHRINKTVPQIPRCMSTATIHNKRLLLKQNSGVQSLKIALVAVEVALKSVDPFLLVKNSMKLTGSELCINDVDRRSK